MTLFIEVSLKKGADIDCMDQRENYKKKYGVKQKC